LDDKEYRERLRELMREEAELPWEEWIRPLVEDGIVDRDGNVLVCMPPPPRTVYDEQGNATVIYPNMDDPPPPPNPPRRRPRAGAGAVAKTKPKAKPRAKKPKTGPA
jgi:hypothetical protein